VGRIEDLIVIRGRNHHPQDIELTLQHSSPELCDGRGAAFTVADDGEERLVIVAEVSRPAGRLDVGRVAATIRAAVAAEHCLQVHTVALLPPGALPKTPSGKVRRRACAALFERGRLPELSRSMLAQRSDGDRLRTPRREVLAMDRSLWFMRDIELAAGERSSAIALRIRGELEAAFLDSAVDALVTRLVASGRVHTPGDTAPREWIAGNAHREWLREIDVGQIGDAELADRLEEAAGEPFQDGPLLRVHLYRRATLDPTLLVVTHQLIADFWSLSAFIREFELLFAGESDNAPAAPDLTHFVRHYSWISGSRKPAHPKPDIVTAGGDRQGSMAPSR